MRSGRTRTTRQSLVAHAEVNKLGSFPTSSVHQSLPDKHQARSDRGGIEGNGVLSYVET